MENPTGNPTATLDILERETAASEHWMQLYENEETLLDALERYVSGGLGNGESVVAIATIPHLRELERRLRELGVDVEAARADDCYLTVDVRRALASFMVSGWPDEDLFHAFVAGAIERARAGGRKVRAFGEVVAQLWAEGRADAALRLEQLCNELCPSLQFTLLCAYPKKAFDESTEDALRVLCAAHTRVIVT